MVDFAFPQIGDVEMWEISTSTCSPASGICVARTAHICGAHAYILSMHICTYAFDTSYGPQCTLSFFLSFARAMRSPQLRTEPAC